MSKRWSLGGWRTKSGSRAGLHVSPSRLTLARVGARSDAPMQSCLQLPVEAGRPWTELLPSAVRELGLAKAECVLTLSSTDYALFQVEKPNVPADELLAATKWRVRDLLSFPVEEAVIDAFEVPGMESRGRPPSLMVAAARRSELKLRVDAIKAAGLRPVGITIAEIALRKLAQRVVGEAESLALLMVGHSPGCLAVVQGGTLYVSRKIELDPSDLRALSAGDEGRFQRERAFERLALEVQRTGDYFDSTYQRPPLRKVLLLVDDPALLAAGGSLRDLLGLEVLGFDAVAALGSAPAAADAQISAVALAAAGAWQEAA